MSITINAQQKSFGINFNTGISKIINPFFEDLDDTFKNKIGVSGNIGLYYNHYFTTNSLVEIDLLYSFLSSNETANKILSDSNGTLIKNRTVKFQKRNYYITIPIKYGLKHNEFIYTIGIYTSLNLNNFIETEGGNLNKSEDFIETERYDRYEKIDFGINLGIEKILNNGITIGLNYYHGLNNLSENQRGYIIKNRQLSFGIKYELYRKLL